MQFIISLAILLNILTKITTSLPSTQSNRHSKRAHTSSTSPKAKVELTRLQHKLFSDWTQLRNIQCPVCTHEELANCPSLLQTRTDGECQLPKVSYSCDCCPKCLSKEGEKCGQIQDEKNPSYSKGVQGCEEGLECTTLVSNGVCKKIPDIYEPEMNYEDYMAYAAEYGLLDDLHESSTTFVDSLPLEPGCTHHFDSISSLEVSYPHALGVRLWQPRCQTHNTLKYEAIQCRAKNQSTDSPDQVCWCVDETTGYPTVHMHWDADQVDESVCGLIANSYELSKR